MGESTFMDGLDFSRTKLVDRKAEYLTKINDVKTKTSEKMLLSKNYHRPNLQGYASMKQKYQENNFINSFFQPEQKINKVMTNEDNSFEKQVP